MKTPVARRTWLFVAFVFSCLLQPSTADDTVREFRGRTMGTTYMVKVAGADAIADDKLRIEIDLELRRVNDQMSTYLEASQITRFNQSSSTEWFPVSREFAEVVQLALQVSEKTDGAFDVTVGPLVNAWSFGTTERTRDVPAPDVIEALRKQVGYKKLSVRLDPPSLHKAVPGLQIDLSSIAKGHGVDRVVQRLADLGATDVFVEVGGEVRTAGRKPDGAWRVGIQQPDAESNVIMIAHEMVAGDPAGTAMATSGDYRNAFVADGKSYSHTIDPRTGAPVTHGLASVTIVAGTCAEADAWATALSVVGPSDASALAKREGLNSLLITRSEEQSFDVDATGSLTQHLDSQSKTSATSAKSSANPSDPGGGLLAKWFPLAVVSFGAFAILLSAMGIGVLLRGKPISGSCGGVASKTAEDGTTSCSLCSNPSDACKELREKMAESGTR